MRVVAGVTEEGEYQGVEGDRAFLGDLDLREGESVHPKVQKYPKGRGENSHSYESLENPEGKKREKGRGDHFTGKKEGARPRIGRLREPHFDWSGVVPSPSIGLGGGGTALSAAEAAEAAEAPSNFGRALRAPSRRSSRTNRISAAATHEG